MIRREQNELAKLQERADSPLTHETSPFKWVQLLRRQSFAAIRRQRSQFIRCLQDEFREFSLTLNAHHPLRSVSGLAYRPCSAR
jgi:hypothetical protein